LNRFLVLLELFFLVLDPLVDLEEVLMKNEIILAHLYHNIEDFLHPEVHVADLIAHIRLNAVHITL
jgi:hypothetical protein